MDSEDFKGISHRLVAGEEELREALNALPSEGVVGLDTETFWDRTANLSRVSLIQVATSGGEIIVFDALALNLDPLRTFIESPAPLMAAHNARFDQMVLAGAGFRPQGLIDTLQMARMALSLGSYSLASVSEHLFGIPLDKTLQNSNWRRRPLTRSQLEYAALDARIALRVYEELKRLLIEKGRWDDVMPTSILGLAAEGPRRREKRVRQELLPLLTKEEMCVVKSLKAWRLSLANAQRVPAYMICPDKTLEHLARERPQSVEALSNIYGLGSSKISKFGELLLKALQEACESEQ